MKYTTFISFLTAITLSFSLTAQEKFDGLWGGIIHSSGLDIEVNFEVQSKENRVLLSVPMQKINDQVGSGLKINGDTIFLDYSNFNAS